MLRYVVFRLRRFVEFDSVCSIIISAIALYENAMLLKPEVDYAVPVLSMGIAQIFDQVS